MMYTAKTTIS